MPILMTIGEGTRYEQTFYLVSKCISISPLCLLSERNKFSSIEEKKLEKLEMAMTRMRRLSRPLRPICFPEMSDPTYLHFPCTLPHILQNSPPLLWKTCLTPLITAPHLRSVHPWFPILTPPPGPTCNNYAISTSPSCLRNLSGIIHWNTLMKERHWKYRKHCKCCPGHTLTVSHSPWFPVSQFARNGILCR